MSPAESTESAQPAPPVPPSSPGEAQGGGEPAPSAIPCLPADTPVEYVPGGRMADGVARLAGALAARLARAGESGGAGVALPLLVPVAPDEDVEAVEAEVRRALAEGIPAGASLILRTSGSTSGRGSLVAMSAAALLASARATHERLGGPGQWVLPLPSHHVAGLQILTRSWVAGLPPIVAEPGESGGFSTSSLASALSRAQAGGGRVYVSLVPTQLLRCLEDPAAGEALAAADVVLVGGAALDPALGARAREAGIAVVTTYGMSETGGGCVYDGCPLAGVSVSIEPESGAVDGSGRIMLAGPVVAEAAIGGSAVIRRNAAGEREVVTNDRGLITGGVLRVLGRVDDVIITGGIKVEPRDVEEVLAGFPGVAECCVVGVPDAEWGQVVVAMATPAPGARLDPEALRTWVRGRLDGPHAPKAVMVLNAFPVRGPGKIDRRALREQAASTWKAGR